MLSTPEQVELLRALAPSLRHSEVLWLAGGLHWYGDQEERNGFLSFEELAEGLVYLARVKGGEEGAGRQREGALNRQQQQQPQRGWTGGQQQGYGPYGGGSQGGQQQGYGPYGGGSQGGGMEGSPGGRMPPYGPMYGSGGGG